MAVFPSRIQEWAAPGQLGDVVVSPGAGQGGEEGQGGVQPYITFITFILYIFLKYIHFMFIYFYYIYNIIISVGEDKLWYL